MKDVFDRLLVSRPLNRTAGTVTSQARCDDDEKWVGPKPMKPGPNDPGFRDLTGVKYGRLTVIGLHDHKRGTKSSGAGWVVRCVCGVYETRLTAKIKQASPDAACQECHRKQHHEWLLKNQGSRPVEDFFKPVGVPE